MLLFSAVSTKQPSVRELVGHTCGAVSSVIINIDIMYDSGSPVKIEKLSDSNYFAWKQKIVSVLSLKGLDQHIEDSHPLLVMIQMEF